MIKPQVIQRIVNTTRFGCRHTRAPRFFLEGVPEVCDSYVRGMVSTAYRTEKSAARALALVLRHLERAAT